MQLILLGFHLFVILPFTLSRPIGLTENEVHRFVALLNKVFERNRITNSEEIIFSGSFKCSPPDDCSISLDVTSKSSITENRVLSGNDVLNGLGNGNGNDNGNNGNNNGNIILQIFNLPNDEIYRDTTTPAHTSTSFQWSSSSKEN